MKDPLGIRKYDVAEFYVGSAKHFAYWLSHAFGFKLIAFRGPETGFPDQRSYLLQSSLARIQVTSAVQSSNSEITSFVGKHGDGVKRWAYEVEDVAAAFDYACSHGAFALKSPTQIKDASGYVTEASIRAYSNSEICFVNYDQYQGLFRPGFNASPQASMSLEENGKIEFIDHVVGCGKTDEILTWKKYFQDALAFETIHDFGPGSFSRDYAALLARKDQGTVMGTGHTDPNMFVPLEIVAEMGARLGKRTSPIETYVNDYHGSGIQHIALATNDIVTTIRTLRNKGVEFMDVPHAYYQLLRESRVPFRENISDLESLGILCGSHDLNQASYYLQLFTKPIGDRATFFFEIIQRCS